MPSSLDVAKDGRYSLFIDPGTGSPFVSLNSLVRSVAAGNSLTLASSGAVPSVSYCNIRSTGPDYFEAGIKLQGFPGNTTVGLHPLAESTKHY